jgi:phosphatidylglycerophosphate synthase
MPEPRPCFEATIKDPVAEEWIARIFLRPVAYRIVLFLYATRVHSVHVTASFLAVGFVASWLITTGEYAALVVAALLIQLKSILDAVDGQLARARNSPSRVGRFFDSAADFIVQLSLTMSCAFLVSRGAGEKYFLPLGIAAFLSCEIQNSYWVYYNIAYRSTLHGRRETIVEESHSSLVYPYDENKPRLLAFLRGFYRAAYGWQDRLIDAGDRTAKLLAVVPAESEALWYRDLRFLRASGFLGLGTHLLAMSAALVLQWPSLYFVFALYIAHTYMILLTLWKVMRFTHARKK